MSRRASQYNRRMHLQNYTTTRTPSKQLVKTWADEAPFWGRVEFAYKGEETLGGVRDSQVPQFVSISQVWIYLRYRTDVQFLASKRIRYGTRLFDIISPYDASGDQRELKILCREVQR